MRDFRNKEISKEIIEKLLDSRTLGYIPDLLIRLNALKSSAPKTDVHDYAYTNAYRDLTSPDKLVH